MNRGYSVIALDNPKNAINVGSILRACGCYGVSMLAIGGSRPDRFMGRIPTDTQAAYKHMPVLRSKDIFDVIPYDCVPVAVDLIDGATPLFSYTHPERAFYIFGAEDATLGDRVISRCRDVIYVPTRSCMNLAATANVVLYDRLTKEQNKK